MLPYLIAAAAVVAFLIMWLHMTRKEIKPLFEAVQGADKQARLYEGLLMGVWEDQKQKKEMKKQYDFSLSMYESCAQEYNRAIGYPFYMPTAWILGFRKVPEVMDL